MTPRREEKSHGIERTFEKDVASREELRLTLLDFAEELAFDLRNRGLRGRTVTIKARFGDFHTITRTRTIAAPTNLAPRIYATARELLDRVPPRPLRLLGVSVSGLSDVRAPVQESLFGDEPRGEAAQAEPTLREKKLQRAAAGMDVLRKKYGERTVLPASLLGRG